MHINDKQLQWIAKGRVSFLEQQDLFEHMAECEFCAGRFASAMQINNLIETPPDLQEDILRQTVNKNPVMREVKVFTGLSSDDIAIKKLKKRREFQAYAFKVIFAMSVAVLMLIKCSDIYDMISDNKNGYIYGSVLATEEGQNKCLDSSSKVLDALKEVPGKLSDNISELIKSNIDNFKSDKND